MVKRRVGEGGHRNILPFFCSTTLWARAFRNLAAGERETREKIGPFLGVCFGSEGVERGKHVVVVAGGGVVLL